MVDMLMIAIILLAVGFIAAFVVKFMPRNLANGLMLIGGLLLVFTWMGGGTIGDFEMPTAAISCEGDVTPDLYITIPDKYTPSTTYTTGFTRTLFVNGAQSSDTTSPFAVSPGDSWEYVIEGNSTFFGAIAEGTAPCEEVITMSESVAPISTSATLVYHNDAGTADTAQAIANNEIKIVDQKITAESEKCISVKESPVGILACYSDVTGATNWTDYFDDATPVGAKNVGVPQGFGGFCEVGYELPTAGMDICDGESYQFNIKIDSDNTNDPGTPNDINATYVMPILFRDPNTGEMQWGWSDTDGTRQGVILTDTIDIS